MFKNLTHQIDSINFINFGHTQETDNVGLIRNVNKMADAELITIHGPVIRGVPGLKLKHFGAVLNFQVLVDLRVSDSFV